MGTLLLLKVPAVTLPAEKNTAELSKQTLGTDELGKAGTGPLVTETGCICPQLGSLNASQ